MVELRKEPRHLIAFRHVFGDLVTFRMIVDVSVGIDNLHDPYLARSVPVLGVGPLGLVLRKR